MLKSLKLLTNAKKQQNGNVFLEIGSLHRISIALLKIVRQEAAYKILLAH